jgi:hypothetical protein
MSDSETGHLMQEYMKDLVNKILFELELAEGEPQPSISVKNEDKVIQTLFGIKWA